MDMKNLVSKSGEKHGIVNIVKNSVRDEGMKRFTDPKVKEKAEKLRKEEARIVKARYINKDGPKERLDKPYCRWEGDPIVYYHLIHGEEYELPMGFIKEINEPLQKPMERSGLVDVNGTPIASDRVATPQHQLVPVSF